MADKAERGQDWIDFVLKADAPDYVVIGRARFSQIFHRAEQPFRVTRGEWRAFVEKTGYFEERESEVGSRKSAENQTQGLMEE